MARRRRDPQMRLTEFGKYLRMVRKGAGFRSQEELARYICWKTQYHISASMIEKMERGDIRLLKVEYCKAFAQVCEGDYYEIVEMYMRDMFAWLPESERSRR